MSALHVTPRFFIRINLSFLFFSFLPFTLKLEGVSTSYLLTGHTTYPAHFYFMSIVYYVSEAYTYIYTPYYQFPSALKRSGVMQLFSLAYSYYDLKLGDIVEKDHAFNHLKSASISAAGAASCASTYTPIHRCR